MPKQETTTKQTSNQQTKLTNIIINELSCISDTLKTTTPNWLGIAMALKEITLALGAAEQKIPDHDLSLPVLKILRHIVCETQQQLSTNLGLTTEDHEANGSYQMSLPHPVNTINQLNQSLKQLKHNEIANSPNWLRQIINEMITQSVAPHHYFDSRSLRSQRKLAVISKFQMSKLI